jgi:hypothetical protein
VLAGSFPVELALLRVGVHDLIKELPDNLLECLMILTDHNVRLRQRALKQEINKKEKKQVLTHLGVIRAMKTLGEVSRLGIWHVAESADEASRDNALLATKDADLETRVLRSLEDLVSVKAVERLGRVLARNGAIDEDGAPAGMQVSKAG